jgi:alpha-tubulin suppressor-like RCC1 family protein
MRVRRSIAAAVTPAVLILVAGTGIAGLPEAATAATHSGRPGRTAPNQSGAGASSVVSVRAWGDNSAGELGDGSLTERTTPVPVGSLTGVQSVSLGGRHGLALLANGTVMSWGDNTFGQLGNGTTSANHDAELPVAVTGLPVAVQVAAGGEHSLALLPNGTVMAWGDNGNGQLGNGTTTNSDVPVAVKGLTNVKAISAGDLFSVAVLANGTVMAWGRNNGGQLGNGTFTDSNSPIAVKGISTAVAVSAGGQHVLALLSNGTAMSWGDNESGQLGSGSMQPANSNVPVAVKGLTGARVLSAGGEHSMALLSDGTIRVWGDNGFNQLGQPNGFPGGIQNSDIPIPVTGVGKTSAIAAGGLFSMALQTSGSLLAWGDGALGQLGNGSTATLITPAPVKNLTAARVIAAGGAAAAAIVAVAASPPGPPTPSIWQVVPTPDTHPGAVSDLSLAGVSAASATDAWAVGTNGLVGKKPLAEHWNGKSWSVVSVPVPAGSAQASLSGVRDLSRSDAWAVGTTEDVNGLNQRTLIEHWNGTAWSVVPSPNPETGTGASDELTSISGTGPNDLWAAGFFSDGSNFIAMLFEHWNGTAWSFVPPPTEVGFQFADAITAIAPNDVWAVGDTGGQATVSAHWNGTAWSNVPTPFLQSTNSTNFLTGVSAAAGNDVWASGYEGNVNGNNFRQPYMLHWTGTAWKLVQLPNAGTEGSQLQATAVLSANDVWAVGITDQTDGALLALTEHFNGTAWSISPALDPGQLASLPDNALDGVASPGGGVVWAVGTQEIPGQCCLRTLALHTSAG